MDILAAGGLQTSCAPLGSDDAAQLLLQSYGLQGRLKRLATEKDDTFHVITLLGDQYTLKIANPGEDPAAVDLQDAILRHIANRDPGLPVPRAIADRSGLTISHYAAPDQSLRLARLLSFIPGTPLDVTPSTAANREKIGAILARLRHATAGFSHPAENRVLAWDVQHLPHLAPLLDQVGNPRQRALLAAGLDRFAPTALQISGLRHQVLHNDFSKSNLIVDPREPDFVTGIIDFGDTLKTAIAIDVSTAMLNQLPATPDEPMLDAAMDLLRGYLVHADLTAPELRALPHLIMGRIIARALITLARARLFPENSIYILRNTPQCWHQLEWFLDHDADQLSDMFYALSPRPAANAP
jgi:hydroxylysine kinase